MITVHDLPIGQRYMDAMSSHPVVYQRGTGIYGAVTPTAVQLIDPPTHVHVLHCHARTGPSAGMGDGERITPDGLVLLPEIVRIMQRGMVDLQAEVADLVWSGSTITMADCLGATADEVAAITAADPADVWQPRPEPTPKAAKRATYSIRAEWVSAETTTEVTYRDVTLAALRNIWPDLTAEQLATAGPIRPAQHGPGVWTLHHLDDTPAAAPETPAPWQQMELFA